MLRDLMDTIRYERKCFTLLEMAIETMLPSELAQTVYQEYQQTAPGANENIITISQEEPNVPEPKGPLEFTEEEFANLGEDELQNYMSEIQNPQASLSNAMNTISNTLTRKKRSTNIQKSAF